ncbi:MAG: hypothetical protein CVU44_09760 [Chloroflexi bacterium HGW-Chloroflexi-6]|nr:MAG: hypothetical protein CVU44_09760 [Chloroflexi bacterium HGW-Chloroflexi-6]
MTWFEELTGFREESPTQVRKHIMLDGEKLTSLVNGREMACGTLEIPSLAELRDRIAFRNNVGDGKISLQEVVANVQSLHLDEANAGSLFQVASQFNLLEMMSPSATPELGIGIYENDPTQGPACAIAAGAGTIYRNYFVPINGQVGQTKNNQIDCLADLGRVLKNDNNRLWQMENGYAQVSQSGLDEISEIIRTANEDQLDELRKLLRVGIQRNTQVTLNGGTHKVSQVYCSALPVGYGKHSSTLWKDFAQLILEASYEATICAAILNYLDTGNNRVFLTLLGGGAFHNEIGWITDGLKQALNRYKNWNLEVAIVSYGAPNQQVLELINQFQQAT